MMKTNPRSFTAAATAMVAILGLAACSAPEPESPPEPETSTAQQARPETETGSESETVESALPAFDAPTLDGQDLASTTLAGEPVVLWFWAPWCSVCRGEAGGVAEAAERYEGQVDFVGVAGLGEVEDMRAFTSDTDTDHMTHIIDEDGGIWSDFGVVGQPAFAFVNADGTFETVAGTLTDADLDAHVRDGLLAE
ncbi:redoxin domain-containing protein [Nocardiopsis sp. N85]|uniref:TlpA family protein disulfide reductase n=1 Tax=Nocardiopsis sp. N85 TaxID=3029400 RepID=UPI00237FC3BB|nr:redoxin domain-containing protein [Nocardiopsis sp. N85]MDE3724016.1 redoxin domain-containing protein [Nocardiopsis sp. N85]